MNGNSETATVIAVKPETADIRTVILRCSPDTAFSDWNPGQFTTVSLQLKSGWTKPHPFTIANAPGSNILRITVKRFGSFTNSIHALRPGEEVRIAGPFGDFCGDIETSKSIVMIAGGIGITPFLSVLRRYRRSKPGLNKTTLFWGNPDPEDFFSLGEIDAYHFFMDFSAVIVSEHPFQPKYLKKHRITTLNFKEGLLDAGMLRQYSDFRNADVFICGSKAMREYVLEQVRLCGVARERIKTETFGM
jgi:ferredoxin-NADP reductase